MKGRNQRMIESMKRYEEKQKAIKAKFEMIDMMSEGKTIRLGIGSNK